MTDLLINIFAWIAIFVLATSHWLQAYKIHVHREVRDISIWTYVFLLTGYILLFVKAVLDVCEGKGDLLWVVKQILTIVPCVIVLIQIKIHQQDHWHDDNDPMCSACGEELEPHWSFCPYCSKEVVRLDED